MRVLVDVTHPAHALRYAPIASGLIRRGVQVAVVGRRKDVTEELLARSGLEYRLLGASAGDRRWIPNALRLAIELIYRVVALCFFIHSADYAVVLTSNPSGAIAGRIMGRHVVFDTVDGTSVGLHHHLSAACAHIITSPVSLREDLGPHHIAYRSYKSLAWLHPDRFTPRSPASMGLLRGATTALAVVRVVSHSASHDRRVAGLTSGQLTEILEALSAAGVEVVVSAESDVGGITTSGMLQEDPTVFSSVLAIASLVVTDSASVAEEAAVLGTKSLRITTQAGRRDYLEDIAVRYGLVRTYDVEQGSEFVEDVRSHIGRIEHLRAEVRESRSQLLADHHDGVTWYVDLVAKLSTTRPGDTTVIRNIRMRFDERGLPHAGGRAS